MVTASSFLAGVFFVVVFLVAVVFFVGVFLAEVVVFLDLLDGVVAVAFFAVVVGVLVTLAALDGCALLDFVVREVVLVFDAFVAVVRFVEVFASTVTFLVAAGFLAVAAGVVLVVEAALDGAFTCFVDFCARPFAWVVDFVLSSTSLTSLSWFIHFPFGLGPAHSTCYVTVLTCLLL
tara:strand:- start:2567 stop:3097 length:531 start_codon:yes stop_codon:yes gene_type:complete